MRSRGIGLLLALLLAVGATAGVYLYIKGVRDDAKTEAVTVRMIVSTQLIPAGTPLDPLISQGVFTTKSFPSDAIVENPVTSLEQLRGETTSQTILANEQISTSRLSGTEANTGGILGIRDGYEAITISLDSPAAVGGFVRANDHVTIYAHFDSFKLLGLGLRQALRGQIPSDIRSTDLGAIVVTVVPDVRVLRVGGQAAGSTGASGEFTLELTPEDAARVITANQSGTVWLGLLPPNQEGEHQPPFPGGELLNPSRSARQVAV